MASDFLIKCNVKSSSKDEKVKEMEVLSSTENRTINLLQKDNWNSKLC